MNAIGIMQGRLSPAEAGRLQAFPFASWEEEFHRARFAANVAQLTLPGVSPAQR